MYFVYEYNYSKNKGINDVCSILLEASTMISRMGFAVRRLMIVIRQAHAGGWFLELDTLKLAERRVEGRYDNANSFRY